MKSASQRVSRYGWARVKKYSDPSSVEIGRAALRAQTALVELNETASMRRPAGRVMVGLLFFIFALCVASSIMPGLGGWLLPTFSFALAVLGIVRLVACGVSAATKPTLERTSHLDLVPDWTILIALYREADSVAGLLESLAKLEWDPQKIDLIFACERDDRETLQALTALRRQYQFRIVRVPKGGPRTKPNALQTALPFARGRYLSVYDAEDRPDPSQLRAAFQAFLDSTPDLAVVQAPLVTWNDRESWIARQFALDYAVWFRVMLPFLSRISGILPLGGTSNHFRTDILRKVGGWDPFNVTEDADLGIRLGRLGYRAGLIDPPTHEEAPPFIGAWIKQRGRWIQGHMQTVSLHLRDPFALITQLKAKGLCAFVLGLGMGPLSALYTIPTMIYAVATLMDRHWNGLDIAVGVGLFSHCLVAIIAARRDGRHDLWRASFTQPFYFCLQSMAACRAMWRVVFTPSFWDKTEHGSAARPNLMRLS